ncbi:MAG: translation elongation factor Ts [Elusimicrobia bacterium]|nr:translation elongation factor Ts [Elusimicrobiota bacterium]
MITMTPEEMSRLIRDLREKTGAGMTACKKALEAADWKLDAALTALRKQGQADMAKRSARATKEGAVAHKVLGKSGAIIELNCETDFVARTDEFKALAQSLADKACAGEIKQPSDAAPLVEAVQAKMRENMTLRRLERFSLSGEGVVAGYIHLGAKNGALIEIATPDAAVAANPAVAELAKELLLQIVGFNAKYLRREEVPAEEIAKEKEIHTETLRKEGKPEAAIPKIVEGKINKLFYQTFCLLEQMSARDGKTPIASIIKDASAKAGGELKVVRFARYTLGG